METFGKLKRLSEVLERVALARGLRICVTIVDVHGNLVLVSRMPGSPVLALEMSERKAYTSLVMGCETNALVAQIQPGQALYTLTSSSNRLIAFGGGTKVEFGEEAYGVGISGGTTQDDMEMLRAARLEFAEGEWAPDSMS